MAEVNGGENKERSLSHQPHQPAPKSGWQRQGVTGTGWLLSDMGEMNRWLWCQPVS